MSDIVEEIDSALTVKSEDNDLLARARDEIVRLRTWLMEIEKRGLEPNDEGWFEFAAVQALGGRELPRP